MAGETHPAQSGRPVEGERLDAEAAAWTADDLTCDVCGHVNTARRAYYWGTCEECESVKGSLKATLLKVAGAWARGDV